MENSVSGSLRQTAKELRQIKKDFDLASYIACEDSRNYGISLAARLLQKMQKRFTEQIRLQKNLVLRMAIARELEISVEQVNLKEYTAVIRGFYAELWKTEAGYCRYLFTYSFRETEVRPLTGLNTKIEMSIAINTHYSIPLAQDNFVPSKEEDSNLDIVNYPIYLA